MKTNVSFIFWEGKGEKKNSLVVLLELKKVAGSHGVLWRIFKQS